MATDGRGPTATRRAPSRGAVSGSANEAGSEYRAGVAAWFVTMGLAGRDVEGLDLRPTYATPVIVTLEVDDPVDDIRVTLSGARALLQAKRDLTLGSEHLRETVEQWVKVFRGQPLNRDHDRLVLATESDSEGIVALRDALQRRRQTDPGAPTQIQRRALETLQDLLKDLGIADPDDMGLILDVAAVLRVEITEPNASHRSLSEAVLSERVVTQDEGARAFNDLKAAARSAAIRRHGRVLREWLDALEDAGRTLRAAADGSPSARAAHRKRLVGAYRQRIAARGSEIDLRGLGVAIAPVRVPGLADTWEVVAPAERGRDTTRDLGQALQRRGRLILLGAPGAGKSSAVLQVAGAWAERPEQLVPVVVPLQRFLSAPVPTSLDDLVRAGVEVRGGEGELVRELVERLEQGEGALFLDGLDETRHRRFEVTRALDRITEDIDPGSDCLVATRDVAYAEARTLGWPTARLSAVTEMEEVLHAIGVQLALTADVREGEREAWVRTRLDTLMGHRRQHPILRETPLLTVLALVLLAQRDPSPIPYSRAQILSDLIDEQIERKEVTARGATELWPRNSPEEVIGLLRESFVSIGHQLYDRSEVPRDELSSELAKLLETRWAFASGPALAAASTLLTLWDEAAVFVASGRPPVVSGRLRGMIEVAEARYATRLEGDEVAEWLASVASDDSGTETLLLSAGLSPTLAGRLAEFACARPLASVLLTAAEAVARGAEVADQGMDCLLDALIRRVAEAPSIPAAKALARFRVPDERRLEVIETLESLADERLRATAVALAAVRWNLPVDQNGAVLKRVLVTRPPGGALVDEGWGEAVVGAAEMLLAAGLSCDDEILQAYRHVSMAVEADLDAALARLGRIDLKRRAEEGRYQPLSDQGFLRTFELRNRAWTRMLEHIAEQEPVDLSPERSRRLAELGDFMQTLIPGEVPSTWASQGEQDVATLLRAVDLVIALGGFDPHVLSAQAAIAAGMSPLKASIFLHDTATGRALENWSAVDASYTKNELFDLMARGPLFALLALEALQHAPDPDETVTRVITLLPDLQVDSRRLAARVSLALRPSLAGDWLAETDPVLRRTAAEAVGETWANGATDEATLRVALLSSDAGVRVEALKAVADAGGRVPAAVLEDIDGRPPADWQCMWCQRVNSIDVESCAQCRLVGLRDIGPGSAIRSQVAGP